jgi:hypothetical protein
MKTTFSFLTQEEVKRLFSLPYSLPLLRPSSLLLSQRPSHERDVVRVVSLVAVVDRALYVNCGGRVQGDGFASVH